MAETLTSQNKKLKHFCSSIILRKQDLKDFSGCTQIEKLKPDFYIHSSGLDNGGGGPAVATPSKEEKQRTASKKEVSGKKRARHSKNV